VVPILGVPDALVPVGLPVSQINLFPGYLSDFCSLLEFLCCVQKLLDGLTAFSVFTVFGILLLL